MTADKLARMSMAASVGAGLNSADYGQFSRSLEDMNGCIHQLCRAYQLQEPALPPSPLHHGEEAPTPTSFPVNEFDETGGSEVSTFKRHRSSNRARPDKACLECGRRDTAQWRRGPLGVSTLCNACGIRHARVMKKVQRQQLMRLGISPGCTPPLPDEASDSQPIVTVAHQGQHHHQQHQHPHSRHLHDSWPVNLSSDDERDATDHHAQLPQHAGRSSVYALLN